MTELSKKEYLSALKKLRASGPDRIGLAGDLASVSIGVGAGAAAASTVAAAAGATTLLGSTGLAGMLGGVVVASTPVGWVLGAAAAGGALAYGATQMIRNGSKADITKEGIIERLSVKANGQEPNINNAPLTSENPSVIEKLDKKALDQFMGLLIEKYETDEISQETCDLLKTEVHLGLLSTEEAMELLEFNVDPNPQQDQEEPSWVSTIVEKLTSSMKTAEDPEMVLTETYLNQTVPTLWLLGKTGAGKSSLIAALTQSDDIKVGNGFQPCTKQHQEYNFPFEHPLLKFLDTRGLGESGYDPVEDVETCIGLAHTLVIVCKVDEQLQSDILATLKTNRSKLPKGILVVYTGCKTNIPVSELAQSVMRLQEQFEAAIGTSVSSVQVDFMVDDNVDQLRMSVAELMPDVRLMLMESQADSAESKLFLKSRDEVMWHAAAAGASDMAPVIGMVSVPTIQAKMIYSLASRYGIEWNRRELAEFVSAMGAGFFGAYGTSLIARQVVKLIPGWGQTAGAVSSGAISFSVTYAIGRSAAYYMHAKKNQLSIDSEAIKKLYTDALSRAKKES